MLFHVMHEANLTVRDMSSLLGAVKLFPVMHEPTLW
jgi:hypothetical protein